MRRISIIAGTISGNRGAEAMVSTTIGRVKERFPNAKFTIFSYYPKRDKQLITDPKVSVESSTPFDLVTKLFPGSILFALFSFLKLSFLTKLLPYNVRALAQSDALICVAGVAFIDTRQKFLPFNILTIWPAMIMGVPVFKFAQALGPFKKFPNRQIAQYLLSRCSRVFARGVKTKEHLEDLEIDSPPLDSAADIAFLYQSQDSLSNESESYVDSLCDELKQAASGERRIIGLCPSAVVAANALKEGWNYYDFMSKIALRLLDEGHIVLLFPNATRKHNMSKARNNDLLIIESVVRYVAAFANYSDRLLFTTEDMNTKGIKQVIAVCDLLVVSRFHAMVAGLTLHKPTMIMGWGHKYLEVMKHFGLEKYVIDYKDNDLEPILHMISSMLEDEESITLSIEKNLPSFKALSQHQFNVFFDIMEKRAETA